MQLGTGLVIDAANQKKVETILSQGGKLRENLAKKGSSGTRIGYLYLVFTCDNVKCPHCALWQSCIN